jgi:hypothetical protein
MQQGGFTYTLLDVEEKQPTQAEINERNEDQPDSTDLQIMQVEAAVALGKKLAVTEPADRVALADDFAKVTEAEHAAHRAESPVKPFQLAKKIVADMTKAGPATRKEIIAAGLAAGIKYNTIDGAYYELCVRKS